MIGPTRGGIMRPVMLFSFLFAALVSCPALAQDWMHKQYHSLEDGNRLYSQCQSAQENIKTADGDKVRLNKSTPSADLVDAGACWGYIEGVVDSIPAGEGFDPDENVRASQYVDVVLAYLRDNPKVRHVPAYVLVRTALSEAFPGKRK